MLGGMDRLHATIEERMSSPSARDAALLRSGRSVGFRGFQWVLSRNCQLAFQADLDEGSAAVICTYCVGIL